MTTISDENIGRVRATPLRPRSPDDLAAARSRRFWAWTSTAWLTSVSVTAVVASGDAVPVAVGGMALAAVCNAMAVPEPKAPAPENSSPPAPPSKLGAAPMNGSPMNGYGPGIKPL